MDNIVAFIDAPDPDNLVMVIALYKLFPNARIYVALTGRPVRFYADKTKQTWQWDLKSSMMAQDASASRIKNFIQHFGIKKVDVYDGGIAPRTLVPHHVHFEEYYHFPKADALAAIRYSELLPQEELVEHMLGMDSFKVAVGGPMTGLYQVMVRNPEIAEKISEVHAMFATWGKVNLMEFGDKPRGALQFNVACDPQSAHYVLNALDCPIFLMPTEVTRVDEIGFVNVQALRKHILSDNDSIEMICEMYRIWFDAAILPRLQQNPAEKIFIHDLVSAISLDPVLREAIYNISPIIIESIPYLPKDKDDWGKIIMKETEDKTNFFAAKELKEGGDKKYLEVLKSIFE